MSYEYFSVDAFTDTPYQGAQILIFPRAEKLTPDQMQQIAAEFGFPETVFVTPPTDPAHAKRFRIFTPHKELTFAGHPTIAAAFLLAEIGELKPSQATEGAFVVEQGIGPVQLRIEWQDGEPRRAHFAVETPYEIDRYVPSFEDIAAILSLPDADLIGLHKLVPACVNGSQRHMLIPLANAEVLNNARFNPAAWTRSSATSTLPTELLLFSPHTAKGTTPTYQARLLGPNIPEDDDPPIGSAMPGFAYYLGGADPESDGTLQFRALRGVNRPRLSTLDLEAEKRGGRVQLVRAGGSVALISEGRLLVR